MSQVSPPLRIALIATVAFLGVWALFLRPQPEPPVADSPAATTSTPAASANPSAAAAAASNANASVAAAEAKAGALTGDAVPATGAATSPTPSTADAGAAPDVELNRQALAKLPADVARAVRRDKVVALLFWNSRSPEDRRVRGALRDANTYDGRVFIRVAPISDITRYAPITRGVDVAQSPTLVVVDRDLHAESLVGYVARTTIRQALADAIRAGA
jgi:hypothetical protein